MYVLVSLVFQFSDTGVCVPFLALNAQCTWREVICTSNGTYSYSRGCMYNMWWTQFTETCNESIHCGTTITNIVWCVHACLCVYIRTSYTYVCIWMYVHVYILRTYTYVGHVFICAYMYAQVHTYVCVMFVSLHTCVPTCVIDTDFSR